MYDFINILKDRLKEKQARNNKYSQRAFANFLQIDSGTLSSIMRGKRLFPISQIEPFKEKLKLDEQETKAFVSSILKQRKEKEQKKKESQKVPPSQRGIHIISEKDYARLIKEWEFAAIFSLMELKNFKFDSKWISKRLGISKKRTSDLLNHIDQTNIISMNNKGRHKLKKFDFTTSDGTYSAALQEAHINELNMAKKKLKTIGIDHRYFYSYTYAMNSKKKKKIQNLIEKLKVEINSLNPSDECDCVYQLNIQLYPLSDEMRFKT